MAHIQHWADGFGGTTGDAPLATADDIYLYADASTNVYFVNSANPAGSLIQDGSVINPYATIAAAVSVAGAGDVIYIAAGHTETITSTVTFAARVIVIGAGAGSNRPTFTPNLGSNAKMFNLTAVVHFHGIRVKESSQANSGTCVDASAAGAQGSRFNHCEFLSGQHDTGTKLACNTASGWVSNCRFQATPTTYATKCSGLAFAGVRLLTDCTIVGGTYGYGNVNTAMFGWGNAASGPVGIAAAANQTSIIQCAITSGAYFSAAAGGTSSDVNYSVFMDGLGLVGHPLISGAGLYIHGAAPRIWWVNSEGGTDAAGFGRTSGAPFDTLKYAIDTGGATGLVVVIGGHTETVTSEITVGDATVIVGSGTGTGKPTLTRNSTAVGMSLSAANGGYLLNVKWDKDTQANGNPTVALSAVASMCQSVDFMCNEHQNGRSIMVTAHHTVVDSCTFTSVATSSADRPKPTYASDATNNNLVTNSTFDGGQYGWELHCAEPNPNYLIIENLSLIRNSIFVVDIYGYFQATDCFIQVGTATGGSGIVTMPFG